MDIYEEGLQQVKSARQAITSAEGLYEEFWHDDILDQIVKVLDALDLLEKTIQKQKEAES